MKPDNKSRYITPAALSRALELHNQGKTLDCWSHLKDAGDAYARIAHHVFSGAPSWLNAVRQDHWRRTTGYAFNDPIWQEVGARAQGYYLYLVSRGETVKDGETKYRLPNTRNIEGSYIQALRDLKISNACLMHIAANQFSTPINRIFEGAAKGLACVMPNAIAQRLRRFDMPDWHEVVGMQFGSLGDRGFDNSPNRTNVSYLRNMWNIGVSAVAGTITYLRSVRTSAPLNAAPH